MPSERKLDVAAVKSLVVAGWTGRNVAALEAHIKELEAIGAHRLLRPPACPVRETPAGSRAPARSIPP